MSQTVEMIFRLRSGETAKDTIDSESDELNWC